MIGIRPVRPERQPRLWVVWNGAIDATLQRSGQRVAPSYPPVVARQKRADSRRVAEEVMACAGCGSKTIMSRLKWGSERTMDALRAAAEAGLVRRVQMMGGGIQWRPARTGGLT